MSALGGGEVIPKNVQLAAGRTAQAYNQRKRRKGAHWEDRYPATAVQTDRHLVSAPVLVNCLHGFECAQGRSRQAPLAMKGRNTLKSVDQLAKKAMGLTPTERIRLVEAILYSLDKPDPEIEKSWIAESEARYTAYKRGELEAIDWEEIKERYEH
jgi:putative addiction module component (TIGR02574 family)